MTTAKPKRKRKGPRRPKTVTSHSEAFPFAEPVQVTPERHRELTSMVREARKLRRQAKAAYVRAGELIDEIVDEVGANYEFDLGRGRTARIVDLFARRSVVFKQTGFSRWDIEVDE